MKIFQSHSTAHPSSISQAATVTALKGDREYLKGWISALSERRSIVEDMISRADVLEANIPERAFYFFADCTALFGRETPQGKILLTDLDIATYLLEEAHVGVVHGEAFSLSGHIRIAYAVDTQTLRKACDRVVVAVNSLQK